MNVNVIVKFQIQIVIKMTIGAVSGPRGTPASDGFGSDASTTDSDVEIIEEVCIFLFNPIQGGGKNAFGRLLC